MRRRPNADLEFIRRVIRAITGGIDLDFRSPLPKQLPHVLSLPPPPILAIWIMSLSSPPPLSRAPSWVLACPA
jgi:hypothetical protein